jgi:hypothetical protein
LRIKEQATRLTPLYEHDDDDDDDDDDDGERLFEFAAVCPAGIKYLKKSYRMFCINM